MRSPTIRSTRRLAAVALGVVMAVLLAACGGSSSTNPARDAVLAQAELDFAEQAGLEELPESLEDYVACLLDAVVEELELSWTEIESALEETGDLSSLGSDTDDMPQGVLTCLGELTSADLELMGVSESLLSSADAYGDDPELDALWDACEGGDDVACHDLFWQSPPGSEYESFAQENRSFGSGADSYGDDPVLDALWDACEGGDAVACDDLYSRSPFGSEYESFALDNGGSGGGFFDSGSDADSYGDDPELDALWDACEAGDDAACSDLFWQSPIGSEYESFGSSCAGRGCEP